MCIVLPQGRLKNTTDEAIRARLGDKQKALEWLDRNYEERRALGTLLNVDPAFDSLRSDQRFGDLVRRMGLTPNAKGE
jgi:hypothetical protein